MAIGFIPHDTAKMDRVCVLMCVWLSLIIKFIFLDSQNRLHKLSYWIVFLSFRIATAYPPSILLLLYYMNVCII